MQQQEFGAAVRRWRDRASPAAVGLPHAGRRRAVGLRREELAGLAGISVDYLTRLEQGRATSPSGQVIEALARALRLSDAERELLFRLGNQAVPGLQVVPQRVPPSVQRLLDRLVGNPIAVYDAMWNLILTNPAYEAISGASAWHGIERNGVWRNLAGPGPIALHSPDERAAQQESLVADLRLTAAKYPRDRQVATLITELRRQSPRFVTLWESDGLDLAQDRSRRKTVEHPEVGLITLDCDTLVVAGDDLRVMVYSAEPGSEDAERLTLAIVLGSPTPVEPAR